MTTVAELIEETTNHLYGTHRSLLNVLDGAVSDTTTTTFTMEDSVDPIAVGAFLSVDDELVYVRSKNAATKQVTVLRGQRGSTAATHADGALVEVNPRFPRFRVRRALQDEIRSWPDSVFRVAAVNLDTSDGVSGYNLAGVSSDFYAVLDVQLGPRSASDRVDVTHPSFYVVRDADTAIFASGAGIVVTGVLPTEARDLRVVVARPFDVSTFTDATSLENTVGLDAAQVDIPPLGAAWRLMAARDVKRSFGEGQGEPRRAEEIPPGFAASTATFLKRTRDARLSEEAIRLRGKWPLRF